MKLASYLRQSGDSAAAFAVRIGTSRQAVGRWLRGERIPSPEAMARIVAVTAGAVQPNDFYPALPAADDMGDAA